MRKQKVEDLGQVLFYESKEVLWLEDLVVEALGEGHKVIIENLELSILRLSIFKELDVSLDLNHFVFDVLGP